MFELLGLRTQRNSDSRWRQTPLFEELHAEELEWLATKIQERKLVPGEILVQEGNTATWLYVVTEGRLTVSKEERRTGRSHRIKELGPGDVVGEIGLLDTQPRAASVHARTSCAVAGFEFSQLADAEQDNPKLASSVHRKLVTRLAGLVAGKLRSGSDDALTHAHERAALDELTVNLLILLCAYVLVVAALPELGLKPANTMFASIPILLVFGVASWRFMKHSGYPLSDFGLSYKNLGGSVLEGLALTTALLLAATGVKAWVLQFSPTARTEALIEHPDVMARLAEPKIQFLFGVYIVSSAVQELIVRGALQSMLERLLTSKNRRFKAVWVCAMLFSVSHLHTGLLFALLVFIPALCWGWLFARRRNLAGVVLSHILTGGYVFFVLGLDVPR